ncbi:BnaCnng78390D [Brassica napus]|uniref:BnaCnng78390D protein n=1 Tax=Brassica napus TaxID=3708 RepID=A0A078JY22_BRANA|nr:BnaCnng78390D [Brassica napus]
MSKGLLTSQTDPPTSYI